ncbi:MAG TPA: hypothetical protein VN729_09630 [Ktedonobacteraceae bacterium]|nr:hypothetical protein [Ktedonobacteraceae bacterium]
MFAGQDDATLPSIAPMFQLHNADMLSTLQDGHDATLALGPGASIPLEKIPTSPLLSVEYRNEEEEEEEKRRRAAFLGLGIPLLGALTEAPPGHVPSISGTPHFGQIASVPGTPQLGQAGAGPGLVAGPGPGTPAVPPGSGSSPSAPYSPGSGSPPSSLPGGSSPGSGSSGLPAGGSSGCLMTTILVITTLVIILASIVTLGLTALAPSLALSGSSVVSSGSTMTLLGSSFLPNSSVDLTLDNTIPVYYLKKSAPAQLASTSLLNVANVSQLLQFSAQGKHTLTVQGNGSFSISFLIDLSWTAGQHTMRASETFTHRSASLHFTITGVAITATSTAIPTPTDTPTATPTAAPSPTGTPIPTPTPAVVVPTPTPVPTRTPTPTPTPSPTPTPPPARLSVSPVRINGNTDCSVASSYFTCQITLINNSQLASLHWSASFSNSTSSLLPGSDTLQAGSSETVTLLVPVQDQNDTITITFTGPANSVAVTWFYQIIIQ